MIIEDALKSLALFCLVAVFGVLMFVAGYSQKKSPEWAIPPNVTVEYPDRVCYMWQIPTTNNPRDQYVYCEDRDEQ